MKFVFARMLRTQVVDKEFNGNKSRQFHFLCQENDLDESRIPLTIVTKDEQAAKVLEKYLSDSSFKLIPITSIRVNEYNEGKNVLQLSSESVLHPSFSEVIGSAVLDLA